MSNQKRRDWSFNDVLDMNSSQVDTTIHNSEREQGVKPQEDGHCTDLVPYSLSSPFHDLLKVPERLFHIFATDIVISQAWKPDGSGGTELGYGASVYHSSIVLAYFIESMASQFKNKIGVELGLSHIHFFSLFLTMDTVGCGPGLVSVVASLADMRCIIATDGDEGSMQLTHQNLTRNCSKMKNAYCQQLLW